MAKLNVQLNDEMTKTLNDIGAKLKVDPTDVLRRSVALYEYALEKADPAGQPTLKVIEGGNTTEIKL